MDYHGIQWLDKGTHKKHLSVLNYEKKERAEEVEQLEAQKNELIADVQQVEKIASQAQAKLDGLEERVILANLTAEKFDTDPEWQLPEPSKLMVGSAYKTKIVEPFIKKLKSILRSFISQYIELKESVNDLSRRLSRAYSSIDQLEERLEKSRSENAKISEAAKDYKRVRGALGEEQVDSIVAKTKETKKPLGHSRRERGHNRGR